MKTPILVLALTLLSVVTQAQFETDYHPIQCSGQLPNDFITLSSAKYEAERAALKHDKGHARKVKDQFILESNFEIDNLLLSGKVVFNNPLSDYVNKVADKVLAKDPETRKKLRFYILKSPYVNATTTNQGIIFVNIGLLAQLENEAQLAYILSHEIIHYKNKHTITHAVEADKIERGKGSYNTFSRDEKLIANRSFSKELETEADLQGFDIFKKTLYSTTNLIGVYDVLKYAYLPFDDVPFDKSFLENSSYRIPSAFVLNETAPINTKDEADNPKSTHPSIKARREMIMEKIAEADNAGKSDYLVGKEQFEKMRTTARFELSRLYLLHHDYEEGIYNSYMLLKNYPDNIYLKKNVLECLENIASFAESSDFDKAHNSYDNIEGKMQVVNYLFEKMDSASAKDIAILALAYAAKIKHEYPRDLDISEHIKYLIHLLVEQGVDIDYFSDSAPSVAILAAMDSADKAVPEISVAKTEKKKSSDDGGKITVRVFDTKEENSKYEKIKKQEIVKKEEVKAGKGYYGQYALVDYYKETWLKDYFSKESEKNLNKDNSHVDVTFGRGSTVSSRVFSLGMEKVLIVNPYYARLNANHKKKFKYLKSEDGQIDFVKRLKQNGRRSRLNVEILDSRGLNSSDVAKMNDITLLEEYVTERLDHQNSDAPYPEREKITKLAQKYGTDYFMWTGVISYKDYMPRKTATAVMSGIFPFILPFTLSYLINGGHYTYYFNMVYDVKTDQVKMGNFREVESRTGRSILNSHIYDTFQQLHAKPKASKDDSRDSKKNKKTEKWKK